MREHQATWEALKRIVREINERLPLFQGEHVWWPRSHRLANSAKRYNAAMDSAVTSVRLVVRQGNDIIRPGDYVVTVNTTAHSLNYSFTLTSLSKGGLPVVGETRQVEIRDSWITDDFSPFDVHIYGPLPEKIKL